MNDGLKDKHRRAVLDILAAHPGVEKIMLFGSRAMGTHTITSDVDIVIFGDRLTLTDQARLARKIDELPVPQRVDLLRYQNIKDKKLLAHIRKHGVEWFRRTRTRNTRSGEAERCSTSHNEGIVPTVENRRTTGWAAPDGMPELPADWEHVSLSDLGVPERGITYGIVQPGKHQADGIPIVRVNDIRAGRINPSEPLRVSPDIVAKYRRTELQGGELLLTLVGTVGESAIVPDELAGWNVARAVAVIPIVKDIGARWVRICLRMRELQHLIRTWCTTTVQATFNLRDVARLPIPIPPKHVRDAISQILESLDDKIELNRRMNRTLEQMAAAIFKAWFVDFEPVKAKANGAKSFPSMPQEVFDALPTEFTDSSLGLIPRGWAVKSVADVSDVNGWTLGKRDVLPVVEYVEISEVMRGEINEVTVYERGTEPSRARRRLRHGDTVMSTVRPDRGAYFLALDPSDSLVASTGFAVLSPKEIPWSLLYVSLARTEVLEELGRLADGAAYPAVRPDVVGNLPMVMPGDAVTDAFHEVCEPLLCRADLNRREARTLAAIRDALLPKLLSGEIRVGHRVRGEQPQLEAVSTAE